MGTYEKLVKDIIGLINLSTHNGSIELTEEIKESKIVITVKHNNKENIQIGNFEREAMYAITFYQIVSGYLDRFREAHG